MDVRDLSSLKRLQVANMVFAFLEVLIWFPANMFLWVNSLSNTSEGRAWLALPLTLIILFSGIAAGNLMFYHGTFDDRVKRV